MTTATITIDNLDEFMVPTALYDARLLAKAWLSVSLASASDPEAHPALDRTVSIEHTLPLVWRWGGADKMALFEVADSYPWVLGAVMPMRWDFDTDRPVEAPSGGDGS